MSKLSPVQETIADQINARELNFAKFQLTIDGTHKVGVHKGTRAVIIELDEGTDTYNVWLRRLHKFELVQDEKLTHIYCEDLRGIIERHFPRFEYVMDSIKIIGVNA